MVDIQQSFYYAQQGNGQSLGTTNVSWFVYGAKTSIGRR